MAEGHPACKKWEWWRCALVSRDGVEPSQIVSVSASVNLPLHHKVQKRLYWHRLTRVVPEKGKRGHKTVVVVVCVGWMHASFWCWLVTVLYDGI